MRPICVVRAAVVALVLAGAAPVLAQPRPAPRRAAAPGPLTGIKEKLRVLEKALAELPSMKAQVKDLHLRVVKIRQIVARLERVAASRADLLRKVEGIERQVKELERQIDKVSGESLRSAFGSGAKLHGLGGGITAGWYRGFVLSVAKDKFRLRVGGVLRVAFSVGHVVADEPALEPDRKVGLVSFGVPTARFRIDGHIFSKRWTYYFELEAAGGQPLRNAEMTFWICKWFSVTGGLLSVEYSRASYLEPFQSIFIRSAPATDSFAPSRDLGLKLTAYQWKKRIFEEMAIYNGAGLELTTNDNIDFMVVGRVGVQPLGPVPDFEGDLRSGARPPRLYVAAAYLFVPMPAEQGRDLDGKRGPDNFFLHQVGAQVGLMWKGLSFDGELYFRHENHGAAVTQLTPPEKKTRNRLGGFAQVAYYLRKIRLQFSARYSYLEPVRFWDPKARGGDGDLVHRFTSPLPGSTGVPEAVHEATFGVAYYPVSQFVRLVANYSFFLEKNATSGATTDDRQLHLVALLAQLNF